MKNWVMSKDLGRNIQIWIWTLFPNETLLTQVFE
jgi:hypothetical protein